MKKLLAMLLALALLLSLSGCGKNVLPEVTLRPTPTAEPTPEPTPAPAEEIWYGRSGGVELRLTLSPNGGYTLKLGGEARSGDWAEHDGSIVLDRDEAAPLYRMGDKLSWPGMGLLFSTQESEIGAYIPGEPLHDGVTAESFNGYWTGAFVELDGQILSAVDLGDRTDVFIEAPRAALGGPLFGDITMELHDDDGALSCAAGGLDVKLRLQDDGLLRMELSATDSDMTLYLQPVYVEGVSP